MKKRFLSVLLAVVLCVGLAPTTAFASRGTVLEEAKDYTFGTTVSDTLTDKYSILSYGRAYKFSIPKSGAVQLSATAVNADQFICGVFDSSYTQVWQHAEDNRTLGGMGKNVQPVNETIHLTGGDYYFAVDSFYAIDYSFSMTYIAANESFPETGWGSDNSKNEANEIVFGVTYSGQLAENDREDYYRFTMPKAGQLTLDVSAGQAYKGGFSSSIYRYGYYRPEYVILGSERKTIDLEAGSYYYVVSPSSIKGPYGNYSFCLSFSGSTVSGVSLSEQNLTLKVNERAELSASVQPEDATNQTVIWSSSDRSIATVDNTGRVTAVAPGTAAITATTEDGGFTAQCWVTVEKKIQNVRGVSLSQFSLKLAEGDSAVLTASVSPQNATNQTVIWSSNDRSIATVDDTGRVTAVAPGTATITATTEDGGFTAQCRITVEKRVQNVTGVALSQPSMTLTEGESIALTAVVSPQNAIDQAVSWLSSDRSIATVDNTGRVTAVAAGTATITVTTKNGGFTAQCRVTVTPTTPTEPTTPTVPTSGSLQNFTASKTYYSGLFQDVSSNSWYVGNVASAYQFGLMKGQSVNMFSPESNVTYAEVITLAARIHSIYYYGKENFETYDGGNWYDPYVNYARVNNISTANYSYNQPATREEFVHILVNALPREALSEIPGKILNFADSQSIVYGGDVDRLCKAGVINGVGVDGVLYFMPDKTVTRAEAAAIITRMVQPDLRIS